MKSSGSVESSGAVGTFNWSISVLSQCKDQQDKTMW